MTRGQSILIGSVVDAHILVQAEIGNSHSLFEAVHEITGDVVSDELSVGRQSFHILHGAVHCRVDEFHSLVVRHHNIIYIRRTRCWLSRTISVPVLGSTLSRINCQEVKKYKLYGAMDRVGGRSLTLINSPLRVANSNIILFSSGGNP